MERLPESISAYIFDLDGVIFDSERVVIDEWKLILEQHGSPYIEEAFMKSIGVNAATCRQIFLSCYGEDFPYDSYCDAWRKSFREKYGHGRLPMKPGVKELLACLKQKGFRIAIASSTRTQTVREELRDAGLLDFFDIIVGGDMAERSKPAPDIFLKAAEALDVLPEACCVIEDSYNGIRAARAAGMFPVMVPDLLPPDDEMREKAGRILNSLAELQAAVEKTYQEGAR